MQSKSQHTALVPDPPDRLLPCQRVLGLIIFDLYFCIKQFVESDLYFCIKQFDAYDSIIILTYIHFNIMYVSFCSIWYLFGKSKTTLHNLYIDVADVMLQYLIR